MRCSSTRQSRSASLFAAPNSRTAAFRSTHSFSIADGSLTLCVSAAAIEGDGIVAAASDATATLVFMSRFLRVNAGAESTRARSDVSLVMAFSLVWLSTAEPRNRRGAGRVETCQRDRSGHFPREGLLWRPPPDISCRLTDGRQAVVLRAAHARGLAPADDGCQRSACRFSGPGFYTHGHSAPIFPGRVCTVRILLIGSRRSLCRRFPRLLGGGCGYRRGPFLLCGLLCCYRGVLLTHNLGLISRHKHVTFLGHAALDRIR